MEEIQYLNEHLWPGQLGHFANLLGFVAAILAAISYFYATRRRNEADFRSWRSLGRGAFLAHGISIFIIIGVIFYIMIQKYYEYQYVQAHVNEDLPFKYVFSAFWEGQEGSFLLWMFWHIVLGFLLIFKAKEWESPVMSILSLIQVFIGSMILGVYIGFGEDPIKIGSSPVLLLRDVMDAPIFTNADYVSMIKGTGLNPLLQNYWMTIHPPTLFLGFASTAIPFCFAIAGLWTGKHKEWLKPAMSWALFSAGILGTGILMGGAWAYEALSFGGYWAWDPVENMSLVPWLILIAGVHTNLIAKNTTHSIRSTYIFYILTFVFIVYSTYLTRSGVLGDTSVHAFTEMGLEAQLVLFIFFFLGLGVALFVKRYKSIPAPEKEEPTASKEFWMFIGSLVLLFSALIITTSTSLPVYNKIRQFFDPSFEGSVITDPIPHYNRYQLWIAIFIGLISGTAQFLRYKAINWDKQRSKFLFHTGVCIGIAALLTFMTTLWIEARAWQYWLLLFSGLFTLVANLDYGITFLKGNLKLGASVLSHVGFGLMIVGIMASSLNKNYISSNPFLMDGLIEGADEENLRNNILLFKNSPMFMKEYEVTYTYDTLDVLTRTYTVNYKRKNQEGEVIEEFNLYPNVLYDKSFTKIAASNPSTKRYLHRDVFTHIASLPQVEMDLEYRKQKEDSLNYQVYTLGMQQPFEFVDTIPLEDQDTFVTKAYRVQIERLNKNPKHPDYIPQNGDIALGVDLSIQHLKEKEVFKVSPVIVLRGSNLLYTYPEQINELNVKIKLNEGIFEHIFTPEDKLDYQRFNLKQGDQIDFEGYKLTFAGFNKNPEHPQYQKEKGDIAVGGMINVLTPTGASFMARPLYFIRGNRPFNLKDYLEDLGLHIRFLNLDPKTETINLLVAKEKERPTIVPLEIATNSLRSDYIVLEAIEFPGINFFWLGSVLMLLGLFLGIWQRRL